MTEVDRYTGLRRAVRRVIDTARIGGAGHPQLGAMIAALERALEAAPSFTDPTPARLAAAEAVVAAYQAWATQRGTVGAIDQAVVAWRVAAGELGVGALLVDPTRVPDHPDVDRDPDDDPEPYVCELCGHTGEEWTPHPHHQPA